MKYISLQDLIDHGKELRFQSAEQMAKVYEQLPSTEIVRCKDCKWCIEHYDTDGNVPYWICRNWDSGTDADGFCYEAERIEDAAN